jgi:tripartite-type tricarboxylate transporter receptor subunit TctC
MTDNVSMLLRPIVVGALLVVASVVTAVAQTDFPRRTVKIVVPIPPGAALDTLPRLLAEKLATRWGQPVIIENRPGAAQNLGAEAVAKAEPEGYTLLAAPPNPLVISQTFYPKLGFDPAAFVPISIFATQPFLLVVNPKVPAATLAELIAYAKANPGKLNFASPGTGTAPHLTGEMLKLAASIQIVHVPYTGLAPAMTDLIAGHVDMMVDNLGNSLPLVREGKLKALGTASETRIPELPDVPAIAETFPGFYSASWFGMVAPPKTPPGIAAKISQAIAETLRLPDVAKRFSDLSIKPVGTTPEETAAFLKRETERWRSVVVSSGIKPD